VTVARVAVIPDECTALIAAVTLLVFIRGAELLSMMR
jgi:hypothetical protein